MTRIDVTIRGAGVFGLACAWACIKRGARVRVIDPFGIASGSSGGIVGALAPHVPENWNPKKQFQLESLLMAADFWQEIETASGLSTGYARLGRLQPLLDDRAVQLAKDRESTAKALWQDHATWQVVNDPGPFAPISPTGLFVRDTLSARIHPRKACLSLVGAIRTARGEVTESDHTIDPQTPVIHATGTRGLIEMSHLAGRMIGVGVKGQAALLRHNAGPVPQIFAGGVHVVPHGDGTVAIGSTSEREYDDPTSTDKALNQVVSTAIDAVPALHAAETIQTWAGVRPRARSRAPMLGEWPGRPGHFIANGGFKIGFGMAPKVAEVMADLVLSGQDRIPEDFRAAALWP